MTWRQVSCWVLLCDRCSDGWSDAAGLPHFDSRADAVDHARAQGWAVHRARVLCPDCVVCDTCALAGHRWSGWSPAGPFPRAGGGVWRGRVRHCAICCAADWDPPVVTGSQRQGATG